MANYTEVQDLINEIYQRIWTEWYSSFNDIVRASVDFRIGEGLSGYQPDEDVIHIELPEGNLDDLNILNSDDWSVWKIELIHEMLHEYQHKVITQCSTEALYLYDKYRRRFPGHGHDECFFAAIDEKASYFGMESERFLLQLLFPNTLRN